MRIWADVLWIYAVIYCICADVFFLVLWTGAEALWTYADIKISNAGNDEGKPTDD